MTSRRARNRPDKRELARIVHSVDSHEQHDDDCECLCHHWRDDDEY